MQQTGAKVIINDAGDTVKLILIGHMVFEGHEHFWGGEIAVGPPVCSKLLGGNNNSA